jgi:hypothetical protein
MDGDKMLRPPSFSEKDYFRELLAYGIEDWD